ncbi:MULTISPECIES: hypothetical protein [unclassified Microcoleus]|uniref:hypothetical protein n=1 Tax=unclassified Microcoleus TaxID=2642155 RepID=UPI002FD51374
MTTKNLPPNDPIETVFLYRTFFCVIYRRGGWEIRCMSYGYTYPGVVGGAGVAKKQVDDFLDLRYGPRPDRQKP